MTSTENIYKTLIYFSAICLLLPLPAYGSPGVSGSKVAILLLLIYILIPVGIMLFNSTCKYLIINKLFGLNVTLKKLLLLEAPLVIIYIAIFQPWMDRGSSYYVAHHTKLFLYLGTGVLLAFANLIITVKILHGENIKEGFKPGRGLITSLIAFIIFSQIYPIIIFQYL